MDWESFIIGLLAGSVLSLIYMTFLCFRELNKDTMYAKGFAGGTRTAKGGWDDRKAGRDEA